MPRKLSCSFTFGLRDGLDRKMPNERFTRLSGQLKDAYPDLKGEWFNGTRAKLRA